MSCPARVHLDMCIARSGVDRKEPNSFGNNRMTSPKLHAAGGFGSYVVEAEVYILPCSIIDVTILQFN